MLNVRKDPIPTPSVGKSKPSSRRQVEHDPRFPIMVERVTERLSELGINPTQAAIQAGLERTFITDLLEGRKHSVNGMPRLEKLAAALGCHPAYLADPRRFPERLGPWRVGIKLPRTRPPPDRRYRGAQGLYAVKGDGLAEVGAPRGSWLHLVDAGAFLHAERGYRAGQLVLARYQDEEAVRRVVPLPDRIELHALDRGPAWTLGRDPVTVEAVVLKAMQELA